MIRRKIWATATCCLALAGAARAQTSSTPKATIGVAPVYAPAYFARGAAPNPGYRKFVPRNYTAPTPPTYAAPVANLGPATSGAVSEPAELFAIDAVAEVADPPKSTTPTTPAAPAPVAGPAPSVVESPMPMGSAVPPGSVVTSPMGEHPMYNGPMLNGGPMSDAPFLDGCGTNGDGPLPCFWTSTEYLYWQFRGVTMPPLVTTAPPGAPGTLGDSATSVLYGSSGMLNEWNSGFRVRGGFWFPDGKAGIDLGFFQVGKFTNQSTFQSDGTQGLFRPFFNTFIGAEDGQLIAFTDPVAGPLVAGSVTVKNETLLWGAEANYRQGWGMGFGGRLDALVGFRYMRLEDKLTISSNVTTLAQLGGAPIGTLIQTQDVFDASNEFYGGQIGFVGEWQIGLMTFGVRGTVAVGCVNQEVDISGSTSAGAVNAQGGLLALQSTNIGSYSRQRLSVIPEIGVTLGYQCTNNIRIFGGYNALCWTNTVRAGEQINRNVNATYIADPTTGVATPSGAPAPPFHFRDRNFYAHGVSAGLEFRW